MMPYPVDTGLAICLCIKLHPPSITMHEAYAMSHLSCGPVSQRTLSRPQPTCRGLLGPDMLSRLLALMRVSRSVADKLLKELLFPSAP